MRNLMETDEFTVEWLSIRQGLNPCDPFKIKDAIHAILETTTTKPELWENELVLTIQVINPVLNELGIVEPIQFHYSYRLINIIRFLRDHESELVRKLLFIKHGSLSGFTDEIIETLATIPFSKRAKVKDNDLDIELTMNQFDEKEVFAKAKAIRQQKYN